MSRAPIAVFAFNRPDHLRRVLAALRASPGSTETPVTIFIDGPRGPSDEPQVEAVHAVAGGATGFASVEIHAREANVGCHPAMVEGITAMCAEHDRVIVVEDDMLVSPGFLPFVNASLDVYRDDPHVAAVCGYTFPHQGTLPDLFFLRGGHIYGFGTWARAWRGFEPDYRVLRQELQTRRLTRDFDQGVFYYSKMLEPDKGHPSPWDVRWHASAFLRGWFTLFPGVSMVRNIGFDGSGTHVGASKGWDVPLAEAGPEVHRIPVMEDAVAAAEYQRFLRSQLSRSRRFLVSLPGGYPLFLPKRRRLRRRILERIPGGPALLERRTARRERRS